MKTENTIHTPAIPFINLKPTPVPLESPLRGEQDIAQHRRLYCGHYSRCLDQSVREGWAGFTCLHCPLRDYASAGPGSEPFARQRRDVTAD